MTRRSSRDSRSLEASKALSGRGLREAVGENAFVPLGYLCAIIRRLLPPQAVPLPLGGRLDALDGSYANSGACGAGSSFDRGSPQDRKERIPMWYSKWRENLLRLTRFPRETTEQCFELRNASHKLALRSGSPHGSPKKHHPKLGGVFLVTRGRIELPFQP